MKKLTIISLLISAITTAQTFDISFSQDIQMSYKNGSYENLYGTDYGQDYRTFTLNPTLKIVLYDNDNYKELFKPYKPTPYFGVNYEYAQLKQSYHRIALIFGYKYQYNNWLEFGVDIQNGMIVRENQTSFPSFGIDANIKLLLDEKLYLNITSNLTDRVDLGGIGSYIIASNKLGIGYKF